MGNRYLNVAVSVIQYYYMRSSGIGNSARLIGDNIMSATLQTLHITRYEMTAMRAMPSMLHICELKPMTSRTILPVEVAIETLTKKNISMKELYHSYRLVHI